MSAPDAMTRALAVRAFAEGFAAGADPDRARRRRVANTDPAVEVPWRRGYDEGRQAALAAEERFKDELRSAGIAYRVVTVSSPPQVTDDDVRAHRALVSALVDGKAK